MLSSPPAGPGTVLDRAVDRGIITPLQRDEILALDGSQPDGVLPREAASGLNAVTVAYFVGGAAILVAFAWFLVDRWRVLGAGGVLAVSAVYAALFLLVAHRLGGEGFPRARGIAVLAAVAMTPVMAWALMDLAGLWTPELGGEPPFPGIRDRTWEALRWIPMELATVLAALIAVRSVAFGLITLPIPIAIWAICSQLAAVAYAPELQNGMQAWVSMLAAAILLATGYAVDRHSTGRSEDFAWPFYLLSMFALTLGWLQAWPQLHAGRHALPLMSLVVVTVALYLRRRVFLVFAQLGIVGYILWLGTSVFRKTIGFPIALATVGLVVIVGTVWVQRRFPQLATRSRRRPGERPELPGGWVGAAGAITVSLSLLWAAPGLVRARLQDREIREHVLRMRAANVRRAAERARPDSLRKAAPGSETRPVRLPY